MTWWVILIISICAVIMLALMFALFGALVLNSQISREEEEKKNGKSKL